MLLVEDVNALEFFLLFFRAYTDSRAVQAQVQAQAPRDSEIS